MNIYIYEYNRPPNLNNAIDLDNVYTSRPKLWYCCWFRNPAPPQNVQNLVNNGINYQPQLGAKKIFPSTVIKRCSHSFCFPGDSSRDLLDPWMSTNNPWKGHLTNKEWPGWSFLPTNISPWASASRFPFSKRKPIEIGGAPPRGPRINPVAEKCREFW